MSHLNIAIKLCEHRRLVAVMAVTANFGLFTHFCAIFIYISQCQIMVPPLNSTRFVCVDLRCVSL